MTYRDRLLTCPRCVRPLERRTRHESWPCRGCDGVAVEIIELIRLLLRHAPDLLSAGGAHGLDTPTRATPLPPLPCVACGLEMTPVELHGVALDRCYRDELVWFDATELDRVIDLVIAEHEARKSLGRKLRDLLFAN